MIQMGKTRATAGKEKKTYRANAAGWIAGTWRAEGEEFPLTAAQAKYANVSLAAPEAVPAAKRKVAAAGESQ